MAKILVILLVLCNLCFGFAQNNDSIVKFTSAVRVNLSEFKKHQQEALDQKDTEKATMIFNSFVEDQIVGTYFDFLSVRKINGGRYRFKKIKKPTVIFTHADWLVKNKGEVQAMNKLAKEYKNKVNFIFINWINEEAARKNSKKLNANIIVCFADEDYKYDFRIIRLMRNTLGFPTTYQMNDKRIVINVEKGCGKFIPLNVPLKKAKDENYNYLKNKLQPTLSYADSLANLKPKKKLLFF